MKTIKNFLLIGLILGFGWSIGDASAQEIHVIWINPAYRNIPLPQTPEPSKTLRDTVTVTSYAGFKIALLEKLISRVTQVDIRVTGVSFSEVSDFHDRAVKEIEAEDPYTYYNLRQQNYNISGFDGNVTVSYIQLIYSTTLVQEQDVSQRVTQILGEIITSGMNDEQKVKAIHDWVVKNVHYDTTFSKYSAYEALFSGSAVCQGYALLMYKMLKDSGITSRITQGKATAPGSGEVDHGWNLIYLCGTWYHLDATWDDPLPDVPDRVLYTYYLKTDSQMETDHTWIKADYPSSSVAYVEGICALGLNLADVIEGLRVLVGVPPIATLRLTDINGDGRIGHEEIIHALQKIAVLR